jgi:hypothetical protein
MRVAEQGGGKRNRPQRGNDKPTPPQLASILDD